MVPANFLHQFSRSRLKVKGQHFRIQSANGYVMIYGQQCVNICSKSGILKRKYLTVKNKTYKLP